MIIEMEIKEIIEIDLFWFNNFVQRVMGRKFMLLA